MICEFQDVSLRFGQKTVLESISLKIERDDFITIIGPNGAGKTSLLRLIINLEKPTKGRIVRAPVRYGYVPQRIVIEKYLPLTVERFLSLYAYDSLDKAMEMLDEVRIAHLLQAQITDLSGGELQRVLLARALLTSPDILVLDEPVQWVDYTGQQELYQLIVNMHAKGRCAVVLVSHDLHWVLRESRRVICLNGHICCAGTPDDVQNAPSYQALFPNDPTFTTYTHTHNHRH